MIGLGLHLVLQGPPANLPRWLVSKEGLQPRLEWQQHLRPQTMDLQTHALQSRPHPPWKPHALLVQAAIACGNAR